MSTVFLNRSSDIQTEYVKDKKLSKIDAGLKNTSKNNDHDPKRDNQKPEEVCKLSTRVERWRFKCPTLSYTTALSVICYTVHQSS
jgi:hypothetical protein